MVALLQTLAAHHGDVGPGDRQDGSRTPRGGGNGTLRLVAARGRVHAIHHAVARQEGGQMGLHADGTHARAAAAMGDAEGLVQVHVADVGAQFGGAHHADLGIEIGAVEIDLAAMGMDDGADVLDGGFEDAVGGGIGDHQGGEIVLVRLGLGLEIGHIDIALLIAGHHHDLEIPPSPMRPDWCRGPRWE